MYVKTATIIGIVLGAAAFSGAPVAEAAPYGSCAAAEAAGAAPICAGQPGYNTKLDRDRDGVACESGSGSGGAFVPTHHRYQHQDQYLPRVTTIWHWPHPPPTSHAFHRWESSLSSRYTHQVLTRPMYNAFLTLTPERCGCGRTNRVRRCAKRPRPAIRSTRYTAWPATPKPKFARPLELRAEMPTASGSTQYTALTMLFPADHRCFR